MNVYDWLANLPFSDPESSCRIVEVSFNNGSRKDYFRNTTLHFYEKGEMIAVEGVNGFDVGMVNLTGELVRLQLKKHKIDEHSADIKKVLRRATDIDMSKMAENKAREAQVLIRSRAIARQLKLELKMAEVEVQADGRKATFFYIADDRVDFRELIKLYAAEFKVKVEMRQIGARQEAGKVGSLPHLRYLQVQRAEPGVERAVAVAVAPCLAAVTTFIAASADQTVNVGFHDQLQHAFGNRSQKITVAALRGKLGKG